MQLEAQGIGRCASALNWPATSVRNRGDCDGFWAVAVPAMDKVMMVMIECARRFRMLLDNGGATVL